MSDNNPYDYFIYSVPVDEIEDKVVRCGRCKNLLHGFAEFDGVGKYYCEACHVQRVSRAIEWATRFATKHCMITSSFPDYDGAYDHIFGSPEHHVAHCRHSCTNYEELIGWLDRGSTIHRVFYYTIRERIDELVDHAMLNDEEWEDVDDEADLELA